MGLKTSLDKKDKGAVVPKGEPKNIYSIVGSMTAQVEKALPQFMNGNADRFVRVALTELRGNTDLLRVASQNPESFLGAFLTAAQLGLEIGAGMKQAYLVPFGGNDPKVQLIISYIGMMHLCTRAGIKKIDILPVHKKEVEEGRLKMVYGLNESFEFEPIIFGDKGDLMGYVAIAKLPSGETKFKVYDLDFINKRRQVAKSNKFWGNWEKEMQIKTVYRDFTKMLGLSPDLIAQLNADTRDVSFNPERDNVEDIDIANMKEIYEEEGEVTEVIEPEIMEEGKEESREDQLLSMFQQAESVGLDLIVFAKNTLGYPNLKNLANLRDQDFTKVKEALTAEVLKRSK